MTDLQRLAVKRCIPALVLALSAALASNAVAAWTLHSGVSGLARGSFAASRKEVMPQKPDSNAGQQAPPA